MVQDTDTDTCSEQVAFSMRVKEKTKDLSLRWPTVFDRTVFAHATIGCQQLGKEFCSRRGRSDPDTAAFSGMWIGFRQAPGQAPATTLPPEEQKEIALALGRFIREFSVYRLDIHGRGLIFPSCTTSIIQMLDIANQHDRTTTLAALHIHDERDDIPLVNLDNGLAVASLMTNGSLINFCTSCISKTYIYEAKALYAILEARLFVSERIERMAADSGDNPLCNYYCVCTKCIPGGVDNKRFFSQPIVYSDDEATKLSEVEMLKGVLIRTLQNPNFVELELRTFINDDNEFTTAKLWASVIQSSLYSYNISISRTEVPYDGWRRQMIPNQTLISESESILIQALLQMGKARQQARWMGNNNIDAPPVSNINNIILCNFTLGDAQPPFSSGSSGSSASNDIWQLLNGHGQVGGIGSLLLVECEIDAYTINGIASAITSNPHHCVKSIEIEDPSIGGDTDQIDAAFLTLVKAIKSASTCVTSCDIEFFDFEQQTRFQGRFQDACKANIQNQRIISENTKRVRSLWKALSPTDIDSSMASIIAKRVAQIATMSAL